ncbi:hypothetical protein [Longimicrobium sp.]|uniref:hypothetical protein n=1 Tax=Longimicrobium sp. TaxID=2029185 RepID=UPI002E344E96|nr:hypothetical protein [Longimicrobium sp.]HEX6040380.1 hypothetical protein [Longimicrobium sp.]
MAHKHVFPVLMALAALAACDGGSPTGGDSTSALTQAEAQELAYAWDGVGADVIDGSGGPSAALLPGSVARATNTTTFTSTRACPSGGTATVQGTREATRDGQGGGSVSFSATRTDAACTFPARRGPEGGTLTITTTPAVQLTSQQTWTDGQPGTRTSTQKGSFDWTRSGGASGSCTVDLTATWTPATGTHTVRGTFCNRTVDVTRTRTR